MSSLSDAQLERLESAIATANFRITLNNQKANARLKLKKDLTYATNGGIFHINPELITFTSVLVLQGKDEIVILDINNNPVEITNLKEFHETIMSKYYEFMNEFLVEFKSINKSRSARALVGEQ